MPRSIVSTDALRPIQRTVAAQCGAVRGLMPRPGRQATLSSARLLPQEPGQVHAFLSELENHRRLDDRYLRIESLDPDLRGGRIVIGTPLGLRRTALTTVSATDWPERIVGVASVGRHTRALVRWLIESRGSGSHVELHATVLSAGTLDRLLLAAGGRWWLRRRFRSVLVHLSEALDREAAPALSPATS